MRPLLCAFVAIVSITTSLIRISPAAPPPMADRVPEDVILYVGWGGAEAFVAAPEYQQSHLKALLDNSNMRQVAQELVPKLLAKAAQKGGAEAAAAVDMFKMIGGTLWNYPSGAYITVEMGAGNPMPHGAIFSRAGKDALSIQKRLDELLTQVNPPAEIPVRTFVVDDIVGISVGFDEGAMALAGGDRAKPIGNNDNFKAALARVGGGDATCIMYYDNEAMLRLVDAGIQLHNDPQAQEKWPAIREATGIAGLRRVVMSSGFDGKGWSDRVFVDAPAPRKGLLSFGDSSPLPDDLVKMIPATATNAMAGGFDFAKAISEVQKMLAEIDATAHERFGQVLGAAQMYTGVNLETDLFGALGEHWAVYEDPSIAGNGFFGMVGVNKLRDPVKAQRSLNAVSAAITNTLAGLLRKEGVEVAIRTVNSGDITVSYVAVPFISPAWTIKDGYLYFALYPQNALVAAKRGVPPKSILENPAYASVRDRLKVDRPSSIQFSDLPTAAKNHYQALLVVSRGALGFADLFGVRAPELVIPPMDELVKHLEPAGAMSWTDEQGFYWKSTSPFPGAELINGPNIAALALPAMAAGAIQPMMERSQVKSVQTRCASHQRELGQAIAFYANANNGQYPPSLGALVENLGSPQVFLCPKANRQVPQDWQAMAVEQRQAWVDQNASYAYLGAGLTTQTATPATIVLHDRENRHDGQGMNLLYGDGRVEFVPVPQAREALKAQRQGR